MDPPRRRSSLIDLAFAIGFLGLFVLWVGFFVTIDFGRRPSRPGEPAAFLLMVVALLVLYILWSIRNSATRTEQSCQVCGRRFMAPPQPAQTATCPRCRLGSPDAAHERRRPARAWESILLLMAIGVLLSGFYYAGRLVAQAGLSYWIFVPVATLVVAVWWLTVFFLPIVLATTARRQVLSNEHYTLALAREIAGFAGKTFRDGPVTIWSSGPSDPVPMLRQQLELVRSSFSSLIGREVEPRAPLRVYCFDTRDALERYHGQLSLATGNSGGGYVPAPVRMITISLEGILSRLIEPERWVRYLYGFYWLELDEGFLPPFWLREAVAHVLAARGDAQELDRLGRRMLGSLRTGHTLTAAQLFQVPEKTLVKPGRDWADRASFTKLSQWSPQSWSLGEYLFGGQSTNERRARSVAFLEDLKSSDRQEEVFERHFGFSYERLLEDWSRWVLDHGEGTHGPPPARVEDALVREVIPMIRNSQAQVTDRVHAVRMMGAEGYALGSDTLIGLLRAGSEIPGDELVWALESISGLTLGRDPEAWARWWEGLPERARCFSQQSDSGH
jgi:hypothetical protein